MTRIAEPQPLERNGVSVGGEWHQTRTPSARKPGMMKPYHRIAGTLASGGPYAARPTGRAASRQLLV